MLPTSRIVCKSVERRSNLSQLATARAQCQRGAHRVPAVQYSVASAQLSPFVSAAPHLYGYEARVITLCQRVMPRTRLSSRPLTTLPSVPSRPARLRAARRFIRYIFDSTRLNSKRLESTLAMKYRRPPLRAELSSAAVHSVYIGTNCTARYCTVLYSGAPRVCHCMNQHCARARNCTGGADEETFIRQKMQRGDGIGGRAGPGQDGTGNGWLLWRRNFRFVFNRMQNTKR